MLTITLSSLGILAGLLYQSRAWWERVSGVTVVLDYGSFVGKVEPHLGLERFHRIPFAEPPLGKLRFSNPIKPTRTYWKRDSRHHGPGCPQESLGGNGSSAPFNNWIERLHLNPLPHLKPFGPGQEDCLTLSVTRPRGVTKTSRLPVMFFIFPGAFNLGTSWELTPIELVKKSVSLKLPIIHVVANHRVNAFGFLGGKEIAEAGVGNLGLKDLKLALEWVQSYISEFGGDPKKVTIYGESSGGMAVSHFLLASNGQFAGLFRAAICQSGTALPAGNLDDSPRQKIFDYIASHAGGCGNAVNKLECLRAAPFEEITHAVGHFPGTLSFGFYPLPFAPAVDGELVTQSIQNALAGRQFLKVPVITGNVLDEGTILAISAFPVNTEEKLREFLSSRLPKVKPGQLDKMLELWPQAPEQGSPFLSGSKFAITPVYKQYSAILGDVGFQSLRRLFLRATSDAMPTWSYLDQAWHAFPFLGAFHANELPALFGLIPGKRSDTYQKRWISFANNLNPNFPGLPYWSQYREGAMNMIIDHNGSSEMQPDTYRKEAMDWYLNHIEDLAFESP